MTDPRFDEAIRLFNSGEFFRCHDVLEEIWTEILEDDRTFYQGLIHAAVALFHFSEGNLGGAHKMYHSMGSYLRPYAPVYRDIDVERLLEEMDVCFAELRAKHASYPHWLSLDPQKVPRIHFRGERQS